MTTSPTDWIGTPQHPEARDLSQFLIHLTRTEADLASIITQGVIEARAAYGVARTRQSTMGGQKSVCFTEMPVAELTRMIPRGRQFGIVFLKENLRKRSSAQPVWYISNPSAEYAAVLDLMAKSHASSDSVWRLTPFIEGVRSSESGSLNDWRWEREWRVVGDLALRLRTSRRF